MSWLSSAVKLTELGVSVSYVMSQSNWVGVMSKRYVVIVQKKSCNRMIVDPCTLMQQCNCAMFWQNQSAYIKGSSRFWHLHLGISIFDHSYISSIYLWKIQCHHFFQKRGGELQSLVLWCVKRKAWVPPGPGPVRVEMVVVDIGVKVGEGWEIGAGGGKFWLGCMRATFCIKWMTCWVRFFMFTINIWITVMASANWFSKFDDVEVVPDSWDMSEKVEEVERSSVKERAVVREQ